MADYKYFPPEIVNAIFDDKRKADETVRMVINYVNEAGRNLTSAEYQAMSIEAKSLSNRIQANLRKTGDHQRQNKLHNIYLQIKIEEMREDVLMIFTTCNNAAFYVMGNALAKVKQLPEYNARFSKMRYNFNRAEEEWQKYERRLKHSKNGFLSPSRFTVAQRKRYAADLTQEDYTEYWQCIGGKALQKMQDEINVLINKFRLSIQAHGLPHPETSAYVLATASMFMLSDTVWHKTLARAAHNYSIRPQELTEAFADLSLNRMMLSWGRCVKCMGPVTHLNETESRNIDLTLEQLVDHWNETDFYVNSVMETVEEFPEIFRTRGEQKKYLRELSEKLK